MLLPRFDPAAVLSTVDRERVTMFAGVHTMYWSLLSAPDTEPGAGSMLRLVISGGAALPLEVLRVVGSRRDGPAGLDPGGAADHLGHGPAAAA